MTDELAVLLRNAAEKWPEKFEISLMGTVFALANDNSLPGFYIRHHDRLSEPENFTLDHMDAIAQAVGIWFSVSYRPEHNWWGFNTYRSTSPGPWEQDVHYGFDSKREASLAALCAILKYKLENENHE